MCVFIWCIVRVQKILQYVNCIQISPDCDLTKHMFSHPVQFIADDLGVALVVVPARNSELQRPEQTVEHLDAGQKHRWISNQSLSLNIVKVSHC